MSQSDNRPSRWSRLAHFHDEAESFERIESQIRREEEEAARAPVVAVKNELTRASELPFSSPTNLSNSSVLRDPTSSTPREYIAFGVDRDTTSQSQSPRRTSISPPPLRDYLRTSTSPARLSSSSSTSFKGDITTDFVVDRKSPFRSSTSPRRTSTSLSYSKSSERTSTFPSRYSKTSLCTSTSPVRSSSPTPPKDISYEVDTNTGYVVERKSPQLSPTSPRSTSASLRYSKSPERTSTSPSRSSKSPTSPKDVSYKVDTNTGYVVERESPLRSPTSPRCTSTSLRCSKSPERYSKSSLRSSTSPVRSSSPTPPKDISYEVDTNTGYVVERKSPLRSPESPRRTSTFLRHSKSPERTSTSSSRFSKSPLRSSTSPVRKAPKDLEFEIDRDTGYVVERTSTRKSSRFGADIDRDYSDDEDIDRDRVRKSSHTSRDRLSPENEPPYTPDPEADREVRKIQAQHLHVDVDVQPSLDDLPSPPAFRIEGLERKWRNDFKDQQNKANPRPERQTSTKTFSPPPPPAQVSVKTAPRAEPSTPRLSEDDWAKKNRGGRSKVLDLVSRFNTADDTVKNSSANSVPRKAENGRVGQIEQSKFR